MSTIMKQKGLNDMRWVNEDKSLISGSILTLNPYWIKVMAGVWLMHVSWSWFTFIRWRLPITALIMKTLILTITAHKHSESISCEHWSVYLRLCVTSCLCRVCRAGEACCALPRTRLHQRSAAAPGRTDRCVSWTCPPAETSQTPRVTITFSSAIRPEHSFSRVQEQNPYYTAVFYYMEVPAVL